MLPTGAERPAEDPRGARPGARPVLFASDVHLSGARPDMVDAFLRFLEQDARGASALYLLGDLFDLWVGDDDPDPVNLRAMAALARLAHTGVAVRLMHGNRDFLFGADGARHAGVELIGDPTVIDLFGTPTLLMHGDTLCTDDIPYLRARARYRRPWVLSGFLALPRAVRVAIGRHFRAKSERSKRVTAPTIMDVNDPAVADALRRAGCARLIHGHTHRPARHELTVDGRACERFVLADWYTRGSYLRADPDGLRAVNLA
ncbi:MAG: UDP-2,3-diacylglucosamine diphosphatase [Burkholderiales bacterium]|nr:UDP-2,3-diacylglucosamine diphosphatase [Burkholderiales bacterium]